MKKNDGGDCPAEGEEIQSIPAVCPKSKLLFQSAQLEVHAPVINNSGTKREDNEESPPIISCKVLLDSCSHRTHITRAAAEKIRAPVVKRENHRINGFGGVKHRARLYDVVEFVLEKRSNGASLTIQAVVVDRICMPVEGSYVKKNVQSFPHIRDLPLADDDVGSSPQEVNILIGIDFYYDIT